MNCNTLPLLQSCTLSPNYCLCLALKNIIKQLSCIFGGTWCHIVRRQLPIYLFSRSLGKGRFVYLNTKRLKSLTNAKEILPVRVESWISWAGSSWAWLRRWNRLKNCLSCLAWTAPATGTCSSDIARLTYSTEGFLRELGRN